MLGSELGGRGGGREGGGRREEAAGTRKTGGRWEIGGGLTERETPGDFISTGATDISYGS